MVTPPYRFQNARYLDTSYGTTAQVAVRTSPREFSFVLNCADFKTERERLERVLWPYTYSKKDVDEALAKLGSSPVGKGRLWIENYRITPGQKSAAGVDLGVIRWRWMTKKVPSVHFVQSDKQQGKSGYMNDYDIRGSSQYLTTIPLSRLMT